MEKIATRLRHGRTPWALAAGASLLLAPESARAAVVFEPIALSGQTGTDRGLGPDTGPNADFSALFTPPV